MLFQAGSKALAGGGVPGLCARYFEFLLNNQGSSFQKFCIPPYLLVSCERLCLSALMHGGNCEKKITEKKLASTC